MISRLILPWLMVVLSMPVLAKDPGFFKLEGHGGPIRTVAVAQDDTTAATAGFDNAIGLWTLADGAHLRWLEGHDAAVNSIALSDHLIVSGGDDYTVRIWRQDTGEQLHALEGHRGNVQRVRVSGGRIASASWDGRVGIWDLQTGEHRLWLEHPATGVNDVAFLGKGDRAISAASDGKLRLWDTETGAVLQVIASHGFGINRIEISEDAGWIAYGAVDGGTRVLKLDDFTELADLTLDRRPILALAVSADGAHLAVGDGEGYIMLVETDGWVIRRDFRAARRGPIWALAFHGLGGVIAGGLDPVAFRWPLSFEKDTPRIASAKPEFHQDPATLSNGARQFFRKCSICHSLTPGHDRRAGPTLYGIFGRPAGSLSDYRYSEAMKRTEIVWSEDTVARLFELGPDVYTPGSKMPMQRITKREDRRDLIEFLKARTAPAKEN